MIDCIDFVPNLTGFIEKNNNIYNLNFFIESAIKYRLMVHMLGTVAELEMNGRGLFSPD